MSSQNFNRINIWASLMASNIAMLVTEWVPDSGNPKICLGSAFFSHWLVLVVLGWTGMEYYRQFGIIRDFTKANAQRQLRKTNVAESSRKKRLCEGILVWCKSTRYCSALSDI